MVVAAGALALVQVGGVMLVLVAVLGLVSRRVRATSSARSIRLTPQHAVHVVEVGGRAFIVGTGPQAAPRLLAELPHAPADLSPSAVPAGPDPISGGPFDGG